MNTIRPWRLTVLAFIAIFAPACAQESKNDATVHETVSTKVFQEKLKQEGGEVLDVRTPGEFESGHLDKATNLNFYDGDFKEKIHALPKDRTYFVYCRSGGRSGKTLAMMKEAGFLRVYDLAGGITAWKAEGLPLIQ